MMEVTERELEEIKKDQKISMLQSFVKQILDSAVNNEHGYFIPHIKPSTINWAYSLLEDSNG